jgi:hypothetical protein
MVTKPAKHNTKPSSNSDTNGFPKKLVGIGITTANTDKYYNTSNG